MHSTWGDVGCPRAAWQVLGALHGLHSLCVFFNVLRPRLYVAAGGLTAAWSVILLNAMNLAVACR